MISDSDLDAPVEQIDARIHQGFTAALEARGFHADSQQQQAIDTLGQWLQGWCTGRRGWLRKPAAGVYLWGGVGRGKSFVMDAFFAAAPFSAKRRVHFHAFLQELQQRMQPFAGHPDPLVLAIRALAQDIRLLCFDEFHVHDIGDAMLLRRLLDVLVEEGVGLVMTSNYPPAGLCPNPLYRERFTPAIEMLEKRFTVLALDAGTDYRELPGNAQRWGEYLWPQSAGGLDYLQGWLGFDAQTQRDQVLTVNHHPLPVRALVPGRAWVEFAELCGNAHSTADFLWLLQRYPRLALTGVPPLDSQPTDACQRFINLVDIAYDAGAELLLCSEFSLERLCRGSAHQDFVRTRSRLGQLQMRMLEPREDRRENAPAACNKEH
ncbi:cell division protein ZapE [Pseudomonas punonensis]|uniref:Cell division protein ZapE n=1 Tax=Phytopseudomonas punonensis TaxID=1220495 RepID=A0A1M7DVM7_9GAMM|nr:cell division protein ZapE [Pseudomonas punonensis]